ncbi:MAG: hypothetical protein PF589_01820 [Gammaproteobacteria bacterium]|jgi:hypothetical protein|nr:hypothetical protein [Gammaproteobacteria bacterium]
MKYSAFIILFAVISLSACQPNTESPSQVTKEYWQALKNNDLTSASKLVSKNSQSHLSRYFALPEDQKIPLDEIYVGAEYATVTTIINPESSTAEEAPGQSQHDIPTMTFETILTLEDGRWKVDATRTQNPVLQEADKSSHDAPSSDLDTAPLNEALQESAEMLNQFMREGSKEMSETFLEGMNKMNETLREAIDKMKQRREQQEPAQPPANENNNADNEDVI